MKRRLSALLLVLLLAVTLAVPALAAGDWVTDEAGLLTDQQISQLSQRAAALAHSSGVGVYIRTVDDYADYGFTDVETASYTLYHNDSLGVGDGRDGVLLLLSVSNRKYAAFVYGDKAELLFPDSALQQLEDGFLDDFRNDDWYGGFSDFVSGCEWYLQHVAEGGEAGVPVHNEVEISDSTQEDTADDSFSLGGALGLSLLISCVIALIVCMVFRSQMKSVRTQTTANQYVGNGGLNLTLSRDIYRYTSQKRRQIPRNDNNNNSTGGGHGGAGFSGSISHTSSSGHGRSGKF